MVSSSRVYVSTLSSPERNMASRCGPAITIPAGLMNMYSGAHNLLSATASLCASASVIWSSTCRTACSSPAAFGVALGGALGGALRAATDERVTAAMVTAERKRARVLLVIVVILIHEPALHIKS